MAKFLRNKFYVGQEVKALGWGTLAEVLQISQIDGVLHYKLRGHSCWWKESGLEPPPPPTFRAGDRVMVRGYLKPMVVESTYSSHPNKYWLKGCCAPVHASKMSLVPDEIEFGECG